MLYSLIGMQHKTPKQIALSSMILLSQKSFLYQISYLTKSAQKCIDIKLTSDLCINNIELSNSAIIVYHFRT